MTLVRPLQLFLCCANAEIVENDIAFGVCEFFRRGHVLLCGGDKLRVLGVGIWTRVGIIAFVRKVLDDLVQQLVRYQNHDTSG